MRGSSFGFVDRDDDDLPPQVRKDLSNATPDELAAFALRVDVGMLCDKLHDAIDAGLDAEPLREVLHSIIGLWEANHSDLTFADYVERGRPCACDDCGTDVMPHDEDGRLMEGGSEYYMVTEDVWKAASGESARYLCIGCLEGRLGRTLLPADFMDLEMNEPSWIDTPRLVARVTGEPEAG